MVRAYFGERQVTGVMKPQLGLPGKSVGSYRVKLIPLTRNVNVFGRIAVISGAKVTPVTPRKLLTKVHCTHRSSVL
jgi:hypothetical protein